MKKRPPKPPKTVRQMQGRFAKQRANKKPGQNRFVAEANNPTKTFKDIVKSTQ